MEPPKRLPFLLNRATVAFSAMWFELLLGPMAVLPRGTFAFLNIAESLRSMPRLAGRRDASPCGLIRENAALDKAAPALARKRISLPSCQTLLLFRRLLHLLSLARP